MEFNFGRINLKGVAQGVGGLVFGNENASASEDSHVERLLDRVNNGVLAEDRRAAMAELQSLVAESNSVQLAFGAIGFPVLMSVLKEERDDVELFKVDLHGPRVVDCNQVDSCACPAWLLVICPMGKIVPIPCTFLPRQIQATLETLVGALTPIGFARDQKNEVQPSLLNSDLLSREPDSVRLLLSLLSEEDFYIQYYTLQILTALSAHSSNRLQEIMLTIPRGITRLMDMLTDREVIRNEALLLLTHLTREAASQEIQKIVVFEGAFEKIFNIVKEEGSSDGGVVVQDCFELLNNLISKNVQNQILLRETVGFDSIASLFKLHKGHSYSYTQQKTINLLAALETIELLLMGGPEMDPAKDTNRSTNQSVLAQKVLDHLLMLGIESKRVPVAVRCSALRCIGNLVIRHPENQDILVKKVLGEDTKAEPAPNCILRIAMHSNSIEEFLAAEYVFKCFCEKNPDGQAMLAATICQSSLAPRSSGDANVPFGSILLSGFLTTESDHELETCLRAASVLTHILKDNIQCKERVLHVEVEQSVPALAAPEPLMHRIMKYLALRSSRMKDIPDAHEYTHPVIFRLFIIWLSDYPGAVESFLASSLHLAYLLELVSNMEASIYDRGLAAILLGECVCYNTCKENSRGSFAIVDAISEKIGLSSYFLTFDMLQKSIPVISPALPSDRKLLTRSSTASMAEIEENEEKMIHQKLDQPILSSIFSGHFVNYIQRLEGEARESILQVFSLPRNKVSSVPAEMEQKEGEDNAQYVERLRQFVENQCSEMQELLSRNATLAEQLAMSGRGGASISNQNVDNGLERRLLGRLQESEQTIKDLVAQKGEFETEVSTYRSMAAKLEADLKCLSDAYNSLEQANFQLDLEVKTLRKGDGKSWPDLEAIRIECKEEAQKESEAELNDLLICLGQEQSKVEKLSARLAELGEDVDMLLDGIGEDTGLRAEVEEED